MDRSSLISSFIQRLCEELHYSELLDKAASLSDPCDRMVKLHYVHPHTVHNIYILVCNQPFLACITKGIFSYVHMHTSTVACTHTHTHTHTRAHTHTRTRTHAHARAHTHTHTHVTACTVCSPVRCMWQHLLYQVMHHLFIVPSTNHSTPYWVRHMNV